MGGLELFCWTFELSQKHTYLWVTVKISVFFRGKTVEKYSAILMMSFNRQFSKVVSVRKMSVLGANKWHENIREKVWEVFILISQLSFLFWEYYRFTCSCKKQYRDMLRSLYSVCSMITFCKTVVQNYNQDINIVTGHREEIGHFYITKSLVTVP